MFFFELCSSVFLYFYTVYLLIRDSQYAKKKNYCKNLKFIKHHYLEFLFKVSTRYLENPDISNFLLGPMELEIAGLHCMYK